MKCTPPIRVYMAFVKVEGGWRLTFKSADLRTTLRRQMTFTQDYKVMEMAERGGAIHALDDRQAIEHGIAAGQGGTWLSLTPEQYQKLI